MRLWLIPLCGLAAGIVLAVVMLAVDRGSGYDLVPQSVTGSAGAAESLLGTIITAVVTLLSVVLTVMTVAVQLAMGQFSPRIVGALLRDRLHQLAFALFAMTAAFAIVALLGIHDQKNQVPGLTVVTAYVLALACLAVLIVFVAHAGQRLRATGLIDLVGNQLHVEIRRRFPPGGEPPRLPPDVIASPRPGVIVGFDVSRLVALAVRADCVLELCLRMGDFVPAGAPLLRVHGAEAAALAPATRLVHLNDERTHDLDPAYGFRKLVDIGIRSASDDPTTTVEALHRIHDALRMLVWRPFPTGHYTDGNGALRLVVPVRDWADFVHLAFDEIRLAGAAQPQITRRMRAALQDLRAVAAPDRRPPLDEQLRLLDRSVQQRFDIARDARTARHGDPQGLG